MMQSLEKFSRKPFNQEIIAEVPDINFDDINLAVSSAKLLIQIMPYDCRRRKRFDEELANKSRENAKDLAKTTNGNGKTFC